MKLSFEQKASMLKNGYIHVPGVIPKVMVDQAMRQINHSVGEGMDPAKMPTYRSQSFCPELQDLPVIAGLFNDTPVKALVEDLIGHGEAKPVGSGQIALRFPTLQDPPKRPQPHLDGMYTPFNGMEEGTIGNFTMLVGVLLSPVRDDYAGNFTVWPGTHALYESYFREHGPEALLNGMPPVELPEPIQTKGEPGDVFLVHYQLAHGVATNVSPLTRYAIFFRVKHSEHEADWKAPMKDIWLHWPGIREIQ
ncbi:phytanoyl-CoA dioxygenase family protein [Paenibacillus sacheonensis]|uniref:Phytanoyl-CoA dioxygenase n=1 Tax=Paenibacillus sacheonensis TaxID=742054 RepID=A0A7X5BVG3_9BACL|nr:phytanoyl-CoA dioxygenase family protein [Paenibacillus sacheonensis]MBM7563073.1 hypothetical protein [Paenibacillus sacheonensis]NBC68358.1 hypothetical protein [Paenibacillus sacheonensis]